MAKKNPEAMDLFIKSKSLGSHIATSNPTNDAYLLPEGRMVTQGLQCRGVIEIH